MREECVLSEGGLVAQRFVGSRVLSEYDDALVRLLEEDSKRLKAEERGEIPRIRLTEEDVFGKYDWWQKKYGR